jgi:phage-related protein
LSFARQGLAPTDWKPMKQVGPGAMEIRIHVLGEWRVIYVAKFAAAVYVLHAFEKKTRRTRREDIELARKRYRERSRAVMSSWTSGSTVLKRWFCKCAPR